MQYHSFWYRNCKNFTRLWKKYQKIYIDEDQRGPSSEKGRTKKEDTFIGLGGPMARERTKRAKEAWQQEVTSIFNLKQTMEEEESKLVQLIQIEEDFI